ncbi:hypothetical protein [Dickeya dianthicola]|uniref:hypothetical protein n=1 Tax=Dickeya dianthicola TaxID=204039 RepID=UPI00136FEF01|nr:hypothetical protein [Dickeya dianthicola]MZH99460.1 hypothetical protein [Dickeya dianthicola]
MMNDVFLGLMMLGGFFVLGIGLWALGQWLRRKGYGPQLDALDKHCMALQHRVNRVALPAAAHFYGGMGVLNRMPLFGSKNQVVLVERVRMAILQMEEEERQRDKVNSR